MFGLCQVLSVRLLEVGGIRVCGLRFTARCCCLLRYECSRVVKMKSIQRVQFKIYQASKRRSECTLHRAIQIDSTRLARELVQPPSNERGRRHPLAVPPAACEAQALASSHRADCAASFACERGACVPSWSTWPGSATRRACLAAWRTSPGHRSAQPVPDPVFYVYQVEMCCSVCNDLTIRLGSDPDVLVSQTS